MRLPLTKALEHRLRGRAIHITEREGRFFVKFDTLEIAGLRDTSLEITLLGQGLPLATHSSSIRRPRPGEIITFDRLEGEIEVTDAVSPRPRFMSMKNWEGNFLW